MALPGLGPEGEGCRKCLLGRVGQREVFNNENQIQFPKKHNFREGEKEDKWTFT